MEGALPSSHVALAPIRCLGLSTQVDLGWPTEGAPVPRLWPWVPWTPGLVGGCLGKGTNLWS